MQEEKNIDIKGTLENFVKADEPEMSQEETIAKFQDINLAIKKIANSTNSGNNNEDNIEEQEHLQRIKQELLASLKRVEELEKQIFSAGKDEKVRTKEKQFDREKYKVQQQDGRKISEIEEKTQDTQQKERE